MNVCRNCVPLFRRVSGPVRLLQIPPAMPVLSILSVRTGVLIYREHALSVDDPSDVAHHIQLFRVPEVIRRNLKLYVVNRFVRNKATHRRKRRAKMTIVVIGWTPGVCGESGWNSCSRLESISNANLPSCEGLDDPSDQHENPSEVTKCLHGVLRNCRFRSVDFSSQHPSKTDDCLNLKFGRADHIQWPPAGQQT